MAILDFYDLFLEQLRDLFSAEKQLIEAMPYFKSISTNAELQEAIEQHFVETQGQVIRLENIFNDLGEDPAGEPCKAMEGLIQEGRLLVNKIDDPDVLDAAIIAALQRVEHYEIAGYGTARAFARQIDRDNIAEILQETLDEEGEADKKLTSIAEGGFFSSGVNEEAVNE